MSSKNKCFKKKYAEDPKYRRRKIAYSRKYRAAHKKKLAKRQRDKWKARRPACRARMWRKWHLKSKYGISLDDYKALLKRQRGRCAICRKRKARLCVDHKGRKVRGLLCSPCNCGLGFFRDDPKRMRKAIAYLKASLPPPRRRRRKAARIH